MPKYEELSKAIQKALKEEREAGLALSKLSLLTAEEELRITEETQEQNGSPETFEQRRLKVKSQHPTEIENEAKRKAHREATVSLQAAVVKFHDTLRADISNSLADRALDRIKRYTGSTAETAKLLVDMAKMLDDAPAGPAQPVEASNASPVPPRRDKAGYGAY